MPSDKPFSPASERNRHPLLEVLRARFADRGHVLEIGSGTGQHAVHFAAAMPWLEWQCSDRAEHLPGIGQWLDEAGLPNTPPSIELDVRSFDRLRMSVSRHRHGASPGTDAGSVEPLRFDAAFSANTLHIMGWDEVGMFFAGLGNVLADDATVVVYGPFNYGGEFTSDSNRAFNASLKARDARMGIRDAEAVDALARAVGLRLVDDVAMPANNRCRVWRRDVFTALTSSR